MFPSPGQSVHTPGDVQLTVERAKLASARRWLVSLSWVVIALCVVVAVLMRLYHLDQPFDRDGYDEGVYWQTLRAMGAGLSLYHPLFYSQPPLFMLSTFPGFVLFGNTLWAARMGIVLISLPGFLGVYLLGRSLAGRLGAVAGVLLLLADALYLSQSQTLEAEASSVAFTFLALGFALLWWKQPSGWRGVLWASLAGIALVLSVFCKFLCVSTIVPLALLIGARIWQIRRKQPGTDTHSWLPILAALGLALVTALLMVAPFLGSLSDFWADVITFHEAATQSVPSATATIGYNFGLLAPTIFSFLGLAALYGSISAILRRDWLVVPLVAWLLTTLTALLFYHPLFPHHLIVLEPPLIALTLLGLVKPSISNALLARTRLRKLDLPLPILTSLAVLLLLVASGAEFGQDYQYYQNANLKSASAATQQDLRVAADLRQAITPEQWVITDEQFIAGLADRDTPPQLVDTSTVRIESGYLTLAQLEQSAANPRVHAVLFYSSRFSLQPTAAFHDWVASHYHELHVYGPGKELWVR